MFKIKNHRKNEQSMVELSEQEIKPVNLKNHNLDDKIINILLIEDNPGDIRLIQELLREIGNEKFKLVYQENLKGGIKNLNKSKFHVILLDLTLPDSLGLDSLKFLLARVSSIPIIILTGTDDQTLAIEAVKSGAQDYLIKGKVNEDLLERSKFYSIERQNVMEKLKKSEKKFRIDFQRASFYKDILVYDMNNILQGIISGSQLFTQYAINNKDLKDKFEVLEIINDQVMPGARLISNVRKISQLEKSEISFYPIKLCDILKTSIRGIKNMFHIRNINLKVNSMKKRINVHVNELLKEVFDNIMINAVRHNIKQNAEIRISISILNENSKSNIKMEFIDNGNGIEDSMKEAIFQRGNKEEQYISGMGLGLSLVAKIVKSYNGKIWVEDRIRGDYTQGSNFVIILPELI